MGHLHVAVFRASQRQIKASEHVTQGQIELCEGEALEFKARHGQYTFVSDQALDNGIYLLASYTTPGPSTERALSDIVQFSHRP